MQNDYYSQKYIFILLLNRSAVQQVGKLEILEKNKRIAKRFYLGGLWDILKIGFWWKKRFIKKVNFYFNYPNIQCLEIFFILLFKRVKFRIIGKKV